MTLVRRMRRPAIATAALAALALVANAVQARAEIRPQPALGSAAGPASSPAGARLHTRCRGGAIGLVVRAVPAFKGVRFKLDGRAFESNANGVAQITVPRCGQYELVVAPPARVRPGLRMRFSRWEDETFTPQRKLLLTRDTELQVGFEVEHLVRETFVDLAGRPVDISRVSKIVQSNSLGSRESFAPGVPRWLIGSRVMRRTNGLQKTDILYSVREVVMNGTNVVRQAQQRFYPSRTQHVPIQLLLYSAKISATDRFFGFPIGSRIELVYPDGHVERHKLGSDSSIELRSLPRGTYDVTVRAPGLSPTVPIALTRDQDVRLKIVSYLDLALLFGSLSVGAVVLLLARRPRLRATLRITSLVRAVKETHATAVEAFAQLLGTEPRLLEGASPAKVSPARVERASVAQRPHRVRPAASSFLRTSPRVHPFRAGRQHVGRLTVLPARAGWWLLRGLAVFFWNGCRQLLRGLAVLFKGSRQLLRGVGVLVWKGCRQLLRGLAVLFKGFLQLFRGLTLLPARACWRLLRGLRLPRPARVEAATSPSMPRADRAATARRKPTLRVIDKQSPLQPTRPVWDAAATAGLAPAAKEGLLALTSEVVLAVFDELMSEEADNSRSGSERPRVSRASVERMLAAASSGGQASRRPGTQLGGGSRSRWANSGGFMERARATLEQQLTRRLDDLQLAALVIDGIELAGQPHVVALGITPAGATVPIGLWEGSPDANGRALLTDLIDRGLGTNEGLLVVIDGSHALRKAVRRVFGKQLGPAPAPAHEGGGEIAA